ncbi:MAG: cytochrome P460 family protein [Pseudomonadota bacterium]
MKCNHPVMVVLAVLLISFTNRVSLAADDGKAPFSAMVNASGQIMLDRDFRLKLQHLGSWYVADGAASGFHDVFTEASTIEYFRKHQAFPDGATIVKELRAASAGDYTTGANIQYSNSELKQWFVMVKDTQNRFPGNTNWGEGWGWALFKPGDNSGNVSSDYKTDCLGCHVPARDKDWIYTEAYPVLR